MIGPDTDRMRELRKELDALNKEVEAVLAKRKTWMDAHMPDFSEFKVGDEIWDGRTCQMLGVVSRLYRYWADRDPRYDNQMSIEVEYKMEGTENCFDNTSRHAGGGPMFVTRELAHRIAENRARDTR